MAKDKNKNSKNSFSNKIFIFLILLFCALLALFAGAYVITSFLKYKTILLDTAIIMESEFLLIFGLGFLGLILLTLIKMQKKKPEEKGAQIKKKGDVEKFHKVSFLTEEQLKTDKQFNYCTYDQLPNIKKVGIPIWAEVKNNKMHINMLSPRHTMVIGSSGTGKTTQFCNPIIQILGESGAKPCIVCTDPKGELFQLHSEKLKKRGYKIMVFDLAEPFKSTKWNPMTYAYKKYRRSKELDKEIKVHTGDNPMDYKLKCMTNTYYQEWYELDGFAFADKQTLNSYKYGLAQQLDALAKEDLKDLADILCPIEGHDPIWDRGAREFVYGTMLAMLEDTDNPELGMTEEKFNFYNLAKIVNFKDHDSYNNITKTLGEYFQGRDPLSLAVQLTNQVLTNAPDTKASYLGNVSDKVGIFADIGVAYATSENEMKLDTFVDQPTALFIKVPDHIVTRHPIAAMFIVQLYKVLVNIANNQPDTGGEKFLPRDVYFILDEFANMPKISNMETIIAVARSRHIWMNIILQSYAQLSLKYGNEIASTLKDNCRVHMFIGSNDPGTLKEFSEKCGNTVAQTENVTISKGKDEKSENKTTSLSMESRPLIYPSELNELNGKIIITAQGLPPIKATITPSFKATQIYDLTAAPPTYSIPRTLDQQRLYYDIVKRNNLVLRAPKKSDGGFGDFNSFDLI